MRHRESRHAKSKTKAELRCQQKQQAIALLKDTKMKLSIRDIAQQTTLSKSLVYVLKKLVDTKQEDKQREKEEPQRRKSDKQAQRKRCPDIKHHEAFRSRVIKVCVRGVRRMKGIRTLKNCGESKRKSVEIAAMTSVLLADVFCAATSTKRFQN